MEEGHEEGHVGHEHSRQFFPQQLGRNARITLSKDIRLKGWAMVEQIPSETG